MAIGSIYRCLLEAAHERGVDATAVLRTLGLDEDALFADDARLGPELGRKLLVALVRATGDPLLGLRAAERIRLGDLDLFGYVLWHSRDLAAVFDALVRYAPLLGDTAAGSFVETKTRATVSFGRSGGRLFVPEGGDLAIGAVARLIREWSAGEAKLVEVHLVRGRPRDPRPYERFFGVPVQFDASVGALVYRRPSTPIVRPDADPKLGAILRRQADLVLASLAEAAASASLVERTRAHLAKELDLGTTAFARVAARLGVHERTLRRRLADVGTSYRAIVDDSRRERALNLAHEGVHSVTAMAVRSGFTDVTAFTRAFRRWTGKRPSDYVAERHAETTPRARPRG